MATVRHASWAYSPRTLLFAAGVGLIGGLAGTVFQVAGLAVQRQLIGPGSLLDAADALPWYKTLLIPFGGAIVAALLAYGLTRRRASQGMADVMEAVTLRDASKLRVSATVSRALSSFALIVTGGSIGREGPIAYMAASFGSRFARLVRVPPQRLGIFAACGIAAGMAASYFAPLGAALFALEVVLGNFAVDLFAPVVVASIVSSLVVQGLADNLLSGYMRGAPLYELPQFQVSHPAEILIYLVLGCVAACGAWFFIRSMAETERVFKRLPIPPQLRLPLGGLLIGVIGLGFPHVWGNGYHAVNYVFAARSGLGFVFLLVIMKILATSITIGSGGSGGIFTPMLFVGVVGGLFVGEAAAALFPWMEIVPGPYGVVGMAAAIAATTQAPITAIFLLFELTQETKIVLPLMVAAMSATLTARALGLESIYVARLRKKGVAIPGGIEETTLTTTRVTDIMRPEAVWTRDTATFDMIVGMVQKTRKDYIYVTNEENRLVGVIRLHDIKNFLQQADLGAAVIAADLAGPVPQVAPERTLAEAMPNFDDPEMHELPVVDPATHQLMGVVDRRDVMSALSVEVLQNRNLRAKFVEHEGAQHYVEIPPGHALSRIPVPAEMTGKALANTDFRKRTGLTILTVIHVEAGRETRVVPEPRTVLRKGDALIVMGPKGTIEEMGGEV